MWDFVLTGARPRRTPPNRIPPIGAAGNGTRMHTSQRVIRVRVSGRAVSGPKRGRRPAFFFSSQSSSAHIRQKRPAHIYAGRHKLTPRRPPAWIQVAFGRVGLCGLVAGGALLPIPLPREVVASTTRSNPWPRCPGSHDGCARRPASGINRRVAGPQRPGCIPHALAGRLVTATAFKYRDGRNRR